MTLLTRLLTDKAALNHTRITQEPLAPLQAGEVLLKIDRVAVTTNNITYAAFGDAMQYWNFFPAPEPGWGHMPVWGFADVVASDVDGVAVGERFYGYWPIASHLRVRPVRVTQRGFYDGAAHRQALVSAYNQYTRVSADPAYRAQDEDYQMLLRPLFITSFMLADFLQDNAFFGAAQLVFSSASSKTAYGTAFCLAEFPRVERVGLTSERNRLFVEGLGCYQRTAGYEGLEALDASVPAVYVDFSGDEALRARVHQHFGAQLRYDCYAGSAQNTQFLRAAGLPGPAPQAYFAPDQIRKRNADWGPAAVNQKFNAAQAAFIARVRDGEQPWMRVQPHAGFAQAQALIEALCAGRVDPQCGHVVLLG
ncbi:DUF2855 family protein [Diaphorobacter sp.]|uniref:DUF2855 family protein n=1 Tax=Diaphorobacter sp. TaxID=1934310 RepID=UPI0025884F8B|nr:DUF2855 family protein [Diaphorobacter sp.]